MLRTYKNWKLYRILMNINKWRNRISCRSLMQHYKIYTADNYILVHPHRIYGKRLILVYWLHLNSDKRWQFWQSIDFNRLCIEYVLGTLRVHFVQEQEHKRTIVFWLCLWFINNICGYFIIWKVDNSIPSIIICTWFINSKWHMLYFI